ncbi:hypothetical protein [Aquisphaera insulae]|nr:hypothetical protein [Aquisphaera insulae]
MAPLVLIGITVALHRLFAGHRDGWAIAVVLAGVIVWSVLAAASRLLRE